MAVNPIPEGHNQVSPYLITASAAKVVDFLKATFGARELSRMMKGEIIGHAELKIGDSVVMLSDGSAQFPSQPASMHVYVEDVDAAYARAIKAGAVSLREPADQFYGDRSGGVKDPGGNTWWISTHVEDVTEEEMRRRSQAWQTQSAQKTH
jgi:PhnB protein